MPPFFQLRTFLLIITLAFNRLSNTYAAFCYPHICGYTYLIVKDISPDVVRCIAENKIILTCFRLKVNTLYQVSI